MKRLIATACLLFVGCAAEPNDGKLIGLRTNLEVQPISIEEQSPSFSWQLQTASAEGQQSAYQVTVFDDEGTSIWDSGRVNTSQAANVAYSGPELMPEQRYRWQVNSWLESGATAQGESWFETGLMNPNQSAWDGAQWIGGSATDKVFNADYLSVYKVAVDLQLKETSQQAAFLLGGNDYRLQNANLNIRQVASKSDESFVAFELDVSGLTQADGQAQLHIYRVGYAAEDSVDKPLFSLPIPTSLVDSRNQHDSHTIYIDCEFGLFNIHIDGRDQANNITPVDPSLSPYDTKGLNLNPAGRGNNYLSYPMLADIGFWLKPAQSALFSRVEVRNFRAPSNVIFALGADTNPAYQNIFADQSDQLTVSDAGIKVGAVDEPVVILADPSRDGTPMLRHQFTLADKGIAQARLHATARGVYEMYINGQRVGSDYFAPGLTQYNKHHTYQSYDVTDLLNAGDNVVGALLGEGWWSGNITYTGANWNYFGDQQSLLGKLVVTFADGSQQTITTQPDSWQVFHGGPIRLGSFFQGEIYDARKEQAVEGWSSPGYQNDQWQPAAVVPIQGTAFLGDPQQNRDNQLITSYQDMKLVAHPGNSPQIVKTLQATSVEEVRPGVFVYDMGQNMVGFPRIELGGAAGDGPVLLRYAEVRYPELPEHAGLEGMIMMENFRAALVNDTYYPKGDNDVIQPRFTFHGYRFIEISGITEPLPVESVQGLVVSSVQQLSAHYETSNELVNKLWQNITWSMRGNFLSIPTDTPARNERMGWNGDLNVFAGTALYMADINAFIERHLWALRDIQAQSGRFADVAPVGGGFGGTLWGSAGVIVPWQNYLRYQDISLLQDHYPAMVSYIDFLQSKIDAETGVLIEGPLGDWLSPEGGKNDNTLLWEAYHVHLLAIMQQAAELLEQPEDQARFAQLYQQRKAFFNRTYVDATTGKTVSSVVQTGFGKPTSIDSSNAGKLVDTQASYAIPIAFNVFDESNLPRAQQHLAATVTRSKQDDAGTERPPYSLMTGFIGTASLSEALSMAGHDDLAYRLLQQTSYPSWLYSVVNGATTIWERLNSYTREQGFGGNNSMNSFNHYSFGAVGSWMMGRSLGIRRSQGVAGYQRFDLAPTPDPTGEMSWAQGHYDSPFGRIQSRWAVEEEGTRYQFTVPENTQATLYLPATAGATVTGPELDYQQSGARRMYRLAPGDYTFSVKQ